MSKRTRTAALAGLALALPVVAGGFLVQSQRDRDGAKLLDQVFGYVSQRFVDTLDAQALYERAAKGLVHELNDPYTVLFTPKEATAFTTQTNGRYGGIGMLIGDVKGAITIDRVFPHTPAEEAGIVEGDRIVRIDTAYIKGWKTDQVSNTLKGEPGTKVKVQFERPGVAQPVNVTFTRRVIHIPAVPYAIMLDGKIGYIPLQTFNETATDEVATQLARLQKEGAKGVILDLRDNPGGILEQALGTSNLFLRKGQSIVSVRGRNGDDQRLGAQDTPQAPDVPLVVLVDGGSASASEIVTGALQDHDRALVVGTTSYGKGLVQSVFQLDGGYFLKMTTARYYLPSGRSIQKPRKVVDGRFVNDEEAPDSLEADSVKKNRPAFKSDAGRVVYGGGGVTPDVIVKPDTLSLADQTFYKSLVPKIADVSAVLRQIAQDHKAQATSATFAFQPQWREEFYKRLVAAGVPVDRKQFDAAQPWVTRQVDLAIARTALGDSTVRRRTLADDSQLRTALEMLQRGQSQQQLLAAAARLQTARQ